MKGYLDLCTGDTDSKYASCSSVVAFINVSKLASCKAITAPTIQGV